MVESRSDRYTSLLSTIRQEELVAVNTVERIFEAYLEDDHLPIELGKALDHQRAGGGYVLTQKVLVERPEEKREEQWLFLYPANNHTSILPYLSEVSLSEAERVVEDFADMNIINREMVLDSAIKTVALKDNLSSKEPVFLSLWGGDVVRLVLSKKSYSPHSLEYYSYIELPGQGPIHYPLTDTSLSKLDFPTLFRPVLTYATYSAQKVSILQALDRHSTA